MIFARQSAALYYADKRNRHTALVIDKTSHATGSVTFSTNVAQTVTLGGTVVTFGTSFALGVNADPAVALAITLANLLTYLRASVNANLVKCTYAIQGHALVIRDKLPNVATFTLAASAGTRSGATLALAHIYKRVPL